MSSFRITNNDIIWSYAAQFLSVGAGVITLPFILNKLSSEEIGFNYILITIGSLIALVDLGFAPQFARNFTYVFSGAQELKKEGIGVTHNSINYELLSHLLKSARFIYLLLGLLAFILLLFVGTPYLYVTSNGFTSIPNALLIWIIYSIGSLFQILYSYYFAMLLGAGKVKEQKKALVANKILYMSILISGLYCNLGLLSVSLAQLISPFLGRLMSYKYFYTDTIRNNLANTSDIKKSKIFEIFKILWFNAKRTAIMSVGAYAILRFNMFIAGLYLSIQEFASYGLMIQLVGIIGNISCTFLQIESPRMSYLKTHNKVSELLSEFSLGLQIFFILFSIGAFILVIWGKTILTFIGSNAYLPSNNILIIYCIIMFLEFNHSNFAIVISANNHIPFAPASILTGLAVIFGTFMILRYSNLGILGVVLVQGFCQLAYQNWKWPSMVLNEYQTNFFSLLKKGKIVILNRLKSSCSNLKRKFFKNNLYN